MASAGSGLLVWLSVSDLENACKFYAETLGLELVHLNDQVGWAEFHHPACDARVALRQTEKEPVDDYNAALARETALRERLVRGEQIVSQDELLAAARAMGTRSTQTYAPRAGSIGRGLSTRRRPRRPGVVSGYRTAP